VGSGLQQGRARRRLTGSSNVSMCLVHPRRPTATGLPYGGWVFLSLVDFEQLARRISTTAGSPIVIAAIHKQRPDVELAARRREPLPRRDGWCLHREAACRWTSTAAQPTKPAHPSRELPLAHSSPGAGVDLVVAALQARLEFCVLVAGTDGREPMGRDDGADVQQSCRDELGGGGTGGEFGVELHA
jgi:hypothetical protein